MAKGIGGSVGCKNVVEVIIPECTWMKLQGLKLDLLGEQAKKDLAEHQAILDSLMD